MLDTENDLWLVKSLTLGLPARPIRSYNRNGFSQSQMTPMKPAFRNSCQAGNNGSYATSTKSMKLP